MTSDTIQQVADSLPALGAVSATAVIIDYFVGVVDMIAILAFLLWAVDMVGGTARAVVRGYRGELRAGVRGMRGALDSLSGDKAMEGFGKLFGLALAIVVFGSFELVQLHVTDEMLGIRDGTRVPLVAPVLSVAMVFLSASIIDQIIFFWEAFGKRVRVFARNHVPGMDPPDEE